MNRVDGVRARLVWQTRPIHAEPRPEDWAWLTEGDLARAATIAHPSAMARFVVARALLRELLSALRPDLDPAALRIASEVSGRPYVAGQSHLHVSLSHTDGLAAAAVATTGPVGIDVEHLSRDDLPPARMWLAPAELPELSRLDPELKRLALLHRWVAKEAAIKAHPCPQQAARRRITLLCDNERAVPPHAARRTDVREERPAGAALRAEPPERAHPQAGPAGPDDAARDHRDVGNERSRVDFAQRRTRGTSNASGFVGDEHEDPSAPSRRAAESNSPSYASWCGTGRARLELDGPGPAVRWLAVDWYALADQFLIAVARPPDEPPSHP